jgi:hypothetical protein
LSIGRDAGADPVPADLSGIGRITGELSGAASIQAASREAAAGIRTSGAGQVQVP